MRDTALRALALAAVLAACEGPIDPPDAGPRLADVTLDGLVGELADLDHLARFPEVADYRTLQSSSFDRRSTDPSDPSLEGWFANLDKANFDGTIDVGGRRELVMLEAEGAGAIVRIWSAGPLGTIRIYIDDFERPAIEVSMEDLLGPTHSQLGTPFGYVRARGANLYFPIPFSRRVRVTTDEGDNPDSGLYFHVNYRLYADGIDVEPYSEAAMAGAAASIAEARAALVAPDTIVRGTSEVVTLPGAVTAPGPSGGVIRRLEVRAPGASEEDLRASVLVIGFDGTETIRAPLGDFFGTGPGANTLSTLALAASEDGTFVSRLPMPFATRATIDVEGPLDPDVEVVVDDWDFDERSQHLHAAWASTGLVEAHPRRDLDVAHIRGAGTYVGTHLVVVNPTDIWWGEGDEKIYVDGDAFPTWFGTGTEDYFGYAHTDLTLFSAPYHAQTRTGLTTQAGHISNLRIHVIDAIPFSSSIDFDLELWTWVPSEIALHWVSYWYTRDAEDDFAPLAAGEAPVFDPATFRR